MKYFKKTWIINLCLSLSGLPLYASGQWSPSARSAYYAAILAPLFFGFIIFLGIGIFSSFSKIDEVGTDLWKMTGSQILIWLMHSSMLVFWSAHAGKSFLMATILSSTVTVFFLARGFKIAKNGKIWLGFLFGIESLLLPVIFMLFSVLGA
jgi:hypothetical protein